MSLPPFSSLAPWVMALDLAAHFGAGLGVGAVHFYGLWRVSNRITGGGRTLSTIVLLIGRWIVLIAFLALAGLEGAAPLLFLGLGVLFARHRIMRRVGAIAP